MRPWRRLASTEVVWSVVLVHAETWEEQTVDVRAPDFQVAAFEALVEVGRGPWKVLGALPEQVAQRRAYWNPLTELT